MESDIFMGLLCCVIDATFQVILYSVSFYRTIPPLAGKFHYGILRKTGR